MILDIGGPMALTVTPALMPAACGVTALTSRDGSGRYVSDCDAATLSTMTTGEDSTADA
jgi:hypothetical protein